MTWPWQFPARWVCRLRGHVPMLAHDRWICFRCLADLGHLAVLSRRRWRSGV